MTPDQELTSIRNQLAEAQREIARLNDWEETRRRMDTSDNFLCGHKSQFSYTHDGGKTCFCMECQRDQLKQKLADANALLERWSTEQSAFLKGREDAYEQEKKAFEAKLIACEASREKLLSGIALILPLAKGYAHANPVGSNEKYVELATNLLSEEPQTALTEALKPVRNGLSLIEAEAIKKHASLSRVQDIAKQTLSELDKLCAKGD